MPSKRLLTMGLLSKYPAKSPILKKFMTNIVGRKYTDYERMHMTALWWTPGLNTTWTQYQFERLGHPKPQDAMRRLRGVAYNPRNRERWEHLGELNVQFITQPEVERFLLRRNMEIRGYYPSWVLPVLNDHRKDGWTMKQISEHYKLPFRTVENLLNRSMFDGYHEWAKANLRIWKG